MDLAMGDGRLGGLGIGGLVSVSSLSMKARLLAVVLATTPLAWAHAEDVTARVLTRPVATLRAERKFGADKVIKAGFGVRDQALLLDDLEARDCVGGYLPAPDLDNPGKAHARNCVRERERKEFRATDVLARKGAQVIGGTPELVPAFTAAELFSTALQRASIRIVSDYLDNQILRNLFEGRVDLTFSPGSFLPASSPAPRPVYEVAYSSEGDEYEGVRLASRTLGPGMMGKDAFAASRTSGFRSIDRQLIEVWPVAPETLATPRSFERDATVGGWMKRTFRLSEKPLSKLTLRAERRGVEGDADLRRQFTVRLIDTSGLGFLDFSELVRGEARTVNWELSLPYSSHRISLAKTSFDTPLVASYSYVPSSRFSASLAWNPEGKEEYIFKFAYLF